MGRILGLQDVEAAIRGGSVFAAGGGGWADHGRMLGTAAVNVGQPELVSMDEVPDDAFIATAAAIGAPAGTTEWQMLGVDYVKAVELLQEALGAPIYGLMIGQNGMSSTMNALAAVGAARHQSRRRGRRHARASDRRHGLDRHGELARSRRSRPRSAATAPAIPISSLSCAARPPKFRRSCARPPTWPAASSPAAAIRCAPPTSKKHAALGGISRALELGRCHHGGGSKGRPRRDRRDLPHDLGRNPRRGKGHAQSRHLYRTARSTSARSRSAAARATSCSM